MPIWHKNYFELKAFGKQQVQSFLSPETGSQGREKSTQTDFV